ncbi:hypothetical protein J1N35_011621 [Gossypium stocksii]|uniref:Uncharacterized protein n=1 Tax=Gossypium stocksii TaxID=47602 RepID=A0A9D3W4K1_9ROSI|nr:hypothetical protein J1N35_011621 [Gossypium stocksii]
MKQIEDREFYLPEVAVEQTKDSESYLPEVAVEQVEITNSYLLEVPTDRVEQSYKSLLPEITLERIEALILIPLKMQYDRIRLLKEKKHERNQDLARPGKIGPFKIFALFSLHDNEQRGAAIRLTFGLLAATEGGAGAGEQWLARR